MYIIILTEFRTISMDHIQKRVYQEVSTIEQVEDVYIGEIMYEWFSTSRTLLTDCFCVVVVVVCTQH